MIVPTFQYYPIITIYAITKITVAMQIRERSYEKKKRFYTVFSKKTLWCLYYGKNGKINFA